MNVSLPVVLGFIFASFFFTLLANTILLRFSKTLGIRESNGMVPRWASESRPALGGITFFMVFLLSQVFYVILYGDTLPEKDTVYAGLLFSSVLAFLMGLADDAYNTRPFIKFFSQAACGVIMVMTGTSIHLFESDVMNYCLTVIWVVGIMNSINMIDNMDAIAGIVSGFILVTVSSLIFMNQMNEDHYLFLLICMVSSIAGFMKFNWHPSKIFMGDTGSQFLGNLLAFTGIHYLWNYSNAVETGWVGNIILVGVAFIIPLTDTATVILNRLSGGKSPFVGGKDHSTHSLSYMGLSDRQVAFLYILFSLISGVLVFLTVSSRNSGNSFYYLDAGWCLAVFVFLYLITRISKRHIH